MRILIALPVIALLLLVGQTPTLTPIVRLNCTAANYPLCGASWHEFNPPSGSNTGAHFSYGRNWSATFLPGAGPSGENVVELSVIGIPNPTTNDEYYWGWGFNLSGQPAVPQGVAGRRFIRFMMYIPSPVNAVGPGGGRVGGKLVILGADGAFDIWRLILNWRSNLLNNGDTHDPTRLMFRTEQNIGAGRIDNYSLPMNQWLAIQLEITPSTTASSTDATMRMYMNQTNRNTPTASSTGYAWQPLAWGGNSNARIAIGGYAQAAMTGANVRMRIARFEYDDEWDPNWIPGTVQVPTVPAIPSAIRIVPN